MRVIVSNYIYPIKFSHRGWNVVLNKKISFLNTVSVKAVFTIPNLKDEILSEQRYIKFVVENPDTKPILGGAPPPPIITKSDYKTYLKVSNNFIAEKALTSSSRTENFSANNLLDNFMGSNTTATRKVLKKVETYMNTYLPEISITIDKSEYIDYLRNAGVHSSILMRVRQAISLSNVF